MLRLVLIALILANAGYYAWTQGMLRPLGMAPQEQSEPERMDQQIRPETLQILRVNPSRSPAGPAPAQPPQPPASTQPSAAAAATAADTSPAASEAAECLQAGVFDERQADALRSRLAGLPQGSWVLEPTPIGGRWMVYMGRFDDLETLDRKRAELRARKVEHDRAGGTLEYGLSLGRFSSKDAAERELANLNGRGVRTARVIQERPDAPGFTLRLPAVTEALRPQLDALRPAMAGRTLRTCG